MQGSGRDAMEVILQAYDRAAVAEALEAVSMEEPWALVERFASWVRESGTDEERRAAAYLVERLETLGLRPRVHEPELFLSLPRRARLEVVEPEPASLSCKVPAFAAPTPGEGLVGEVVAVAAEAIRATTELFASSLRLDGDRVAGRVVLADGYAMPGVVRQVEEAGALAAIFVNPGHAHEGIVTTIWGTPGLSDRERIPRLAVLNVPRAAGEELRRRLRRGRCRVRIETQLWQGWAPCPLVVAEIPGRSDDFVLLHGHYDSWHVGIGDNAVGDAALLEVARVLQGLAGRLWRGVRVAWWPGHSTARYGGSTWYADQFAMELRDHCVAQINVDSPGCRWATAYDEVMWMQEAAGFAADTIREVTGVEPRGLRPLRAGDYSFNGIGVTGFFMLLSSIPRQVAQEKGFYPVGGCGGNSDAWHTEGDTLEVADRENLERDIRVYVAAVTRLATAPFVPFDHRAAVREVLEAARGYAAAAEGRLDLAPVEGAGGELLAGLDALYGRVAEILGASGERPAGPEGHGLHAALIPYDRAQLGVARELVPVNYCRRSRFYHDPAVELPPVPDLAVLREWPQLQGDEDGRRFLLAEALRGRNRVVDALRRARERLDQALGG